MNKNNLLYLTNELIDSETKIWINPVGGLGDIIMLSSALLWAYKKFGKKFYIARRSQYTSFFSGHPAVAQIGHPGQDDYLLCNDYWSREEFSNKHTKAIDIIKKIFCISDVDCSDFYVAIPKLDNRTKILLDTIPWQNKNVAISFSSESPRKMMHPIKWHHIVEQLLAKQYFVIQLGRLGDIPIQGCYSLLGATSPLQVFEVLKKVDLVITPDNFVMHAARVVKKPTIALFGPTEVERYGYDEHVNIQVDTSYCEFANNCLGPHVSQNYTVPCPLKENHCMNRHNEGKIIDIAISILNS